MHGSGIEFGWSLHQIEFYTFVPNDDNRASDGRHLREAFERVPPGIDVTHINGPCTVLEMLIALAQRLDFQMWDYQKGDRTAKWFWELVKNLELEVFEDADPYIKPKIEHNNEIIEGMMARTYTRKGQGGLFPMRRAGHDMRKVEIWFQMMYWMDENPDR